MVSNFAEVSCGMLIWYLIGDQNNVSRAGLMRDYRKKLKLCAEEEKAALVALQAEIKAVSIERDLLREELSVATTNLDSVYKLGDDLRAQVGALEEKIKTSDEEAASAYRSLLRKHKTVTRKLTQQAQHIVDTEQAVAEKFALAQGKEKLILQENAVLKMRQDQLKKDKLEFRKARQVVFSEKTDPEHYGTASAEEQKGGTGRTVDSDAEDYAENLYDNTVIDLCEGFDSSAFEQKLDTSSFPKNSETSVSKSTCGSPLIRMKSLQCSGTRDSGSALCKSCVTLKRNLGNRRERVSLAKLEVSEEESALERILHMLPLDDQKAVAVKTCFTLERFGMKITDAAVYAASVIGYSERSVREWKNDFRLSQAFTTSKRGKHSKVESPFDDPILCKQAKEWVAAHAVVKGMAPMSVFDFLQYCNTELLTNWLAEYDREPFTEDTARRWLHKLGFSIHSHKKGLYKDGHDDKDAIAHRKWFLREMLKFDQLHAVPLPQYDSNNNPVNSYEEVAVFIEALIDRERRTSISGTKKNQRVVDDVEFPHLCTEFPHPFLKSIPGFVFKQNREIIYGFSDEVIFNTNDSLRSFWGIHGETPILKPKSEGQGIMHFDIMLSIGCFLEFLTENDWRRAEKVRPGIQQSAALYFEYGKNHEGYFTSDEFLPVVEIGLFIFHFMFPTIQLVIVFDQSGVHWKKGEDALNADNLNLYKPGKNLMRNTSFVDGRGVTINQCLVQFDSDEQEWKSRPLYDILVERGLWKVGMKKEEAADVLATQPDFQAEKCMLLKLVESYGDVCLAQPKCHPELNPIELVWAGQKYYARKQNKTGIQNLRKTVISAREHVKNVDSLFLLKCFRKTRDFVHVYFQVEDATGSYALCEVRKYKSHRRIFNSQLERIKRALNDGIDEEVIDKE
jgi:hypothetical protein